MFSQCFGMQRKNEISLPNWYGGTQSHRHGGALVVLALPKQTSKPAS